ncbi:glycosyltransferase [Bacillus cereus]|uniref:glycosyltransferase n=1 Tax=Bacillus cereus TaxID=1396 RepID=UPI000BECB24E|nr:glycosyltransferase [Bacillus cereus]PEE32816.1 glycosyl transferase [Bacillus cereus]PET42191.1 glycosyl transferase [Bacillus cereus]PEV68192.1 glycosyl transferase [Bacillus cereus]PFA40432.1 glycosyl transferase [Bacillus cereus]PFD75330.1 glycosyl transferase [Bacillus cereus]
MITVTLCMIVKDEEDTLERCLQSVAGIPDEIIIIDTGSTDTTKDIASKWTSQVLDFEWQDDFSAARNYSFQHATMEYILWLDADDILLPEDRERLLTLKQTLDPSVDAVSMAYNVLFDSNENVISRTRRFRLLKRSRNFQWHGIVHEDLQLHSGYHHYDSDVIVTHKKIHARSDRNLKIYEQAYQKGKQLTPQDLFHYARELQVHKRYQKALHMYQEFLNTDSVSIEHRIFVYHNMACCYHELGQPEKEHELTLHSFSYDIPQPMFCCRMGEYFIKNQQFSQAAFWYRLAIEVPTDNFAYVIEQPIYKTWLPHKQLGLCYYQLGDYERSYQHNQHVLKYLPNDPDTLTNIKALETLRNNQI